MLRKAFFLIPLSISFAAESKAQPAPQQAKPPATVASQQQRQNQQASAPLNNNFSGYRDWVAYPAWMGNKSLSVTERERLIEIYNRIVDQKWAIASEQMFNDYSGQTIFDHLPARPESQVLELQRQSVMNRDLRDGASPQLMKDRDATKDTPAPEPTGLWPLVRDKDSNKLRPKKFSEYYESASDSTVEFHENYLKDFAAKRGIEITPEDGTGALRIRLDPPSPGEIEAWKRNEEIIRSETLGRSLSSASSVAEKPLEPSPAFDPAKLSSQAREAWQRNQEIIRRETLDRSASGLDPIWYDRWHDEGDRAFDNAPAMRGRFYKTYPQLQKYQEIARYGSPATEVDRDLANGSLSHELLDRSTGAQQKTGTSSITFDPSSLSPEEREARKRNEAIVRNETLRTSGGASSPSSEASKPVEPFSPARLSPQERAGWLRNQANVERETLGGSTRQQVQDWAAKTFPEIEGPGSPGISFGDVSTHTASDGLKAVPNIDADLNPSSLNRHFNKTWTVYAGDRVVAKGFSDVQLLGGGLFAAKQDPLGWGPYRLFSSATGEKPISSTEFSAAQSLGEGLVAILPVRDSTWQIKDDSGQTVGTFNGGGQASYVGKGQVQVNYAFGNPQFIDVSGATSLQHPQPVPRSTTPSSTAPATGGIYLGGQQPYKETKGVESQFDKELDKAEVVPKKKKP